VGQFLAWMCSRRYRPSHFWKNATSEEKKGEGGEEGNYNILS